jgi:hypothetical protein
MKKILIVIDNIIQYDRIKKLIEIKNTDYKFIFKHSNVKSPIWGHPDFRDKQSSILLINSIEDFLVELQ